MIQRPNAHVILECLMNAIARSCTLANNKCHYTLESNCIAALEIGFN